jgi:predicted enzyme related to lactoylglutathione lyase
MAKLLVNVDVDDLERATRFYTEAFQLTVGRRFGPFAVELLGAEAPIYLLRKKPGTPPFEGAPPVRTYDRHWTPVHMDFAVDDIETAVARAEAAGARLDGPIRNSGFGRMALMADPFGHGFCLLQFTGRGYDEVATG